MAEAPLPDRERRVAINWLEWVADQLTAASMWADGESADRERVAIALEDACRAIQAAGWMLERADRVRVSELAHRRMSGDGQGVPQPYNSQTGG